MITITNEKDFIRLDYSNGNPLFYNKDDVTIQKRTDKAAIYLLIQGRDKGIPIPFAEVAYPIASDLDDLELVLCEYIQKKRESSYIEKIGTNTFVCSAARTGTAKTESKWNILQIKVTSGITEKLWYKSQELIYPIDLGGGVTATLTIYAAQTNEWKIII
jgi:hypothetical protein